MKTLFDRLLITDIDDIANEKISIHMIQSLIIEFKLDTLTRAEIKNILGLDAGQEDNLVTIVQALNSSNNKERFWQRVFAYLILAEGAHRAKNGGLNSYLVESNFWSMISIEAAK